MLKFCTYFNSAYLYKGVSMYMSLDKYCDDFLLYILCLDELTYDTLCKLDFSNVKLIKLCDVEDGDSALLSAKSNRSDVEYFRTLTPSFSLYVMKKFLDDGEVITYLDADLLFFSNPKSILDDFDDRDIGLTEHRYSRLFCKSMLTSGVFNVQFLPFRKNENGLSCLTRWREKCNDWCYFRSEDYKLGDQMYLNAWPYLFDKIKSIDNIGAGVAARNVQDYKIKCIGNEVYIDKEKLVFYHFHGLNIGFDSDNLVFFLGSYYIPRKAKRYIYCTYKSYIKKAIEAVNLVTSTKIDLVKLKNKNSFKTKIFMFFEYVLNYLYSRIFS